MSAGAVPIDEEELAAQQAAGGGASAPPATAAQPAPAQPMLGGSQIIVSAPPLPAEEDTRSVHAPVITAKEKVATAAIPDIAADKVAANEAEGAVHAKEAEIRGIGADTASSMAKAHEIETRQEVEAMNAEVADALAARKAKYDELSGMKMHDYFSTERGGNRVLAAIFTGLGALAAGPDGVNHAYQIIKDKIAQDFQLQKENIDKEERTAIRLGHNVQEVMERKRQRLSDLALKQAAGKEAVAAEVDAQLGRHGVPLAQAKTNQISAKLREDANNDALEVYKGQRTEIVNSHTSRQVAPVAGSGLLYGPGGVTVGDIGNPTKAKAINDANANFRDLSETIDQLSESYAKGATAPVFGKEFPTRAALQTGIALKLKTMEQLGQISAGDAKLLSDQVGGVKEQFAGGGLGGKETLATTKKLIQDKHVKYLDSQGLPGERVAGIMLGKEAAPRAPAPRSSPAPKKPAATSAPGFSVRAIARMQKYVSEHPEDAGAKAALRAATKQ